MGGLFYLYTKYLFLHQNNIMKNIFTLALLFVTLNVIGQITLIHTYDTASTIVTNYGMSQLMFVKFEVSGERYVKINRFGKNISIYDMNHSLIKTIAMPFLPANPVADDILYISEQLFDTDPQIEFMHIGGVTPDFITEIYKENGSLIFSDTGAAMIRVNFEQQQFPIYNTSQGTIMILSYSNGQAKVFGLPGTLSNGIQEANNMLLAQSGQLGNLYPNPTSGAVTLQYELPKGETQGEIILYNTQGAEVKRYKVDDTFKDLLLDNTMLPAGVYYYQLTTRKGSIGSKKMIVIK